MLWLALQCTQLSLDLWVAAQPDVATPRVVIEGERPPRVRHVDARAAAAGIAPGMALTAAYALHGDLALRPYEPAAVREALEGLALRLARYTPTLCIADAHDTLLLEVSGSLRLFGGLERLRSALDSDLRELGYAVRIGGAHTPEAALLLAALGRGQVLAEAAMVLRVLCAAPVAALPVLPAQREQLLRVGVRDLGELLRLPRDALSRRCGPGLVEWLDRLRGARPDPRASWSPPERFARRIELFAPVEGIEALVFGVRRLIGELSGWLALRGAGAQRLTLVLAHEHAPITSSVPLALARASRDSAHLFALLRERLDQARLAAPVSALMLELEAWQGLREQSRTLFADASGEAEAAAALIERLRARLGDDAVATIACAPEHRPERAHVEKGTGVINSQINYPRPLFHARAERPAWLLRVPQPLHEREGRPQYHGALTFLSGPERLECGWWDDADLRRDYFLAENTHGQRLWIFRTRGDACWYLHGLFG